MAFHGGTVKSPVSAPAADTPVRCADEGEVNPTCCRSHSTLQTQAPPISAVPGVGLWPGFLIPSAPSQVLPGAELVYYPRPSACSENGNISISFHSPDSTPPCRLQPAACGQREPVPPKINYVHQTSSLASSGSSALRIP